jgi:two-component system sensor histidine kinase HydH
VYAQVIAREVDRLERIVHDVRGMSRELHVQLAETDLHAVIQECLVLVAERLALQHVVLRIDLADRAPVLTLDALRVKQAILNLLANALEAMASGGTLTVATRISHGQDLEAPGGPPAAEPGIPGPRRADAPTYRLLPGEWAVVSVTDTGGGIPSHILEDIYKPFFTTKEAGTGLGLALIRRIARSHGGRVDMDNRPGDGVTFRMWLPAKVAGGPA